MGGLIRMAFATMFLLAASASASDPKAYPDGHGGEVMFPMGDVSFADSVDAYDVGDPAPYDDAADPEAALGIPDIAENDSGFVTLGCAGELVLKFDDNVLVDVAGPDLYVFEIGPDIEPTALAVSGDGTEWMRVGRISGGKAEIDVAPYVPENAEFSYVKLVDLKSACGSGKTPGADIDAVGAIGSAQRIALDSAVLFDTGKYRLKPEAFDAIDEVLATIEDRARTSVVVAGHTDAVGSEEDNQVLSRNRAQAVADYLIDKAGFSAERVQLEAYGESRPVAIDDTPAGRAKNRRVELTVRMPRKEESMENASIEILGLWDSREAGVVELRRVDGLTEGSYDEDARLVGELTSMTVFEGYWVRNHSRRSCDGEKLGSDHWGPIRIEFDSPARDTFVAQWRYCGEDEWRGEWSRATRLL